MAKGTLDISEAAGVGSLYNLALATDLDSSQFGVKEYQLIGADAFELVVNNVDTPALTVQLAVTSVLDREDIDSYELSLYAIDGGDPPLSAEIPIYITVTDSNDHGPIFDYNILAVNISESIALYSVVAEV